MTQIDNYENRYKTKKPEEVVKICKDILEGLGYKLDIEVNSMGVGGMYSSHIKVCTKDGNSIAYSNGKGVTQDLALASGLAETVERIFPILNPKSMMGLNVVKRKSTDYYFDIRESYIKFEDYMSKPDEIRERFAENNTILYQFIEKGIKNDKDELICFPFKSMLEDKISNITVDMLITVNGSNGYCAGSSKEEALVQGISELLERYVQLLIIEEDPLMLDSIGIVNKDEKCVSDRVRAILDDMEKTEGVELRILDLTYNGKYPVAGLLLIDKIKQRAKLNIGAFPDYRVAIERCFTEILQNVTMDTVNTYPINEDIEYKDKNKANLIANGYGRYCYDLFEVKRNYTPNSLTKLENITESSNNIEFLDYYLNLVAEDGTDIYYYDFSYSNDFKVFVLISPKYSFATKIYGIDLLYKDVYEKYLYRLSKLSDDEIKDMLDEYYSYFRDSYVKTMFATEAGSRVMGVLMGSSDRTSTSAYIFALLAYRVGKLSIAKNLLEVLISKDNYVDTHYINRLKSLIHFKILGKDELLADLIDDKSYLNTEGPLVDYMSKWGVLLKDNEHEDMLVEIRNNLLESQKLYFKDAINSKEEELNNEI